MMNENWPRPVPQAVNQPTTSPHVDASDKQGDRTLAADQCQSVAQSVSTAGRDIRQKCAMATDWTPFGGVMGGRSIAR